MFGYVSIRLDELFLYKNGYTPSKENVEYWEGETSVPWFRMEDIRENGRILSDSIQHVTEKAVKGKKFPANSIIVSTSATIGEHALITVPFLANQRFTCLSLRPEYSEMVDVQYAFYYCHKLDEYCKANLNQGNFAAVDMTSFAAFRFDIPSREKQGRIVECLRKLDCICNDIAEGLPAEIEARQKQYDYYRDKLLTFKEKSIG